MRGLKKTNITGDIGVNTCIAPIAPALVVPALVVGALAVALILIKSVVVATIVVTSVVLVVGANGGAVVRADGISGIVCIAGIDSTDGVSMSTDGSTT